MIKYFIEPNGDGIFEVELGEKSLLGLQVTFTESKAVHYYGHPDEFLSWCVDDIQTAKNKRKELIESYIDLHEKKLIKYKEMLANEIC